MSSANRTTTILPVRDLDRATDFYANTLGLYADKASHEGSFFFSEDGHNGIELLLKPDSNPSSNTELSFEVEDIAAEMASLERNGVTFEDYDLPGLRTVNHIAEDDRMRAAWFTDTEGNILCLHQLVT
ncbi:VOC family protein [Arthrobacter sp. B0490]|uniref:VOC family protein n=1 Tax=Arthrobacter sp. B0490 TaxID=2058891 RepID=UPI000CE3AAD1|nr:VOC family protein [Arthrobacter sp. B0490]